MGIFRSFLSPESSHSVSCIDCPESLSLRVLTFQGSRETAEGLSSQLVILTLGCRVKYRCHFFLVKTQMILVTLCFSLTQTATSE